MTNGKLKKEMLTFLVSFHGGKLGIFDFGHEIVYDKVIADKILNQYLPLADSKPDVIRLSV
jgi:hypothetical protein